jgi:hypothetical protein
MKRIATLVAIGIMVAACGAIPEDTVGSDPNAPGTTIVPVTGDSSVSSVACTSEDAWSSVETAFQGRVASVETRANPPLEGWHWVSFEVDRWFTDDYGTSFSMWAPGFEGSPDEEWLIAGALYHVEEQSGEVFACISAPADETVVGEWEDRYGPGVTAGAETPETPADPAVIAGIEEARAVWESAGIDDYTAVITVHDGREGSGDECGSNTSIRVVVVDGVITQAIDLGRFCEIEDTSGIELIDDLFDMAVTYAGGIEEPIVFDETYGFPSYFYATDRSVDVGAAVQMLEPRPMPAVVGAIEALAEAAAARARWEEAGITDYEFDLDVTCFCTIAGRVHVVVEDGVPVEATSESGPVDTTGFDFLEFTIDGVFDLFTEWGGDTSPDQVVAAFDPELGYPLDVRIDHILEAIDDELSVAVTGLTPTG